MHTYSSEEPAFSSSLRLRPLFFSVDSLGLEAGFCEEAGRHDEVGPLVGPPPDNKAELVVREEELETGTEDDPEDVCKTLGAFFESEFSESALFILPGASSLDFDRVN